MPRIVTNGVIVSKNMTNNWFCKRCQKSMKGLIIENGIRYCHRCYQGDKKALKVYRQGDVKW